MEAQGKALEVSVHDVGPCGEDCGKPLKLIARGVEKVV